MSKAIQDSPFIIKDWYIPAIVINSTYEICYWSGYFKEYFEQGKKKALSNYEWLFLDDNRLATASFNDQSYLFLTAATMDNGDTLMIGCATSFLIQQQVRVTELEKINRSLDATIENSYDGIYITDQKGITLYTNSAIERITGIPKEYYLGKSVDQLIKRGILNSSVTHKVVKQRRTVSVVQENYAGKETLITGSPVFNNEGDVEQVVTNIRDLSDLNELMRELMKVNELNHHYKQEIEKLRKITSHDGVVFVSEKMKMIYEVADRISDIDVTVLILGETGVGKDVLARHIFSTSVRSKKGSLSR